MLRQFPVLGDWRFRAFKVKVPWTAQCFEVEYLHYKNNGRIIEMKAIQGGIIKCRVPLTRRFVLIKNRMLAVSSVGDEAPPAPAGRNGGCDEL